MEAHRQTQKLIKKYIKKNKFKKKTKFKLISYIKNKGKGYALKQGVIKAKYDWILTFDLDFSVQLDQILIWENKGLINKTKTIYFGSREHEDSIVNTKYYRKFIGIIFRNIINIILRIKIKDTQCGFKLYQKSIAKKIFKKILISGYEHDLEIVLLAKKFVIPIIELPVSWTHKDLSKINVLVDSFEMFKGILKLKKY